MHREASQQQTICKYLIEYYKTTNSITKQQEVTTMTKKDFSGVNTERVYGTIAEATAEPEETVEALTQEEQSARKERKTYTAEEAAEAMQNLKTAGRKGVKLPRINLAFSPDLYDYVRTMARARGETLTEFVNHILRQSMEENQDIYRKAIEFRNSL